MLPMWKFNKCSRWNLLFKAPKSHERQLLYKHSYTENKIYGRFEPKYLISKILVFSSMSPVFMVVHCGILFIYQTSFLCHCLMQLYFSLVGQGGVTRQPSPRRCSSERCVPFICGQILSWSCSTLCDFFQLEKFHAFTNVIADLSVEVLVCSVLKIFYF